MKQLQRTGLPGLILLLAVCLLTACASTSTVRSPSGAQLRSLPKVMHGQYVVRRGDTLYSIARRHGWNWQALAAHNRIARPYRLKIGQIIRFDNRALPRQNPPLSRPTTASRPPTSKAPVTAKAPATAKTPVTAPKPKTSSTRQVAKPSNPPRATPAAKSAALSAIKWQWPAQGTVITRFADNNGLSQGIDIAGKAGQPIKAAADGLVTYAGNGLYGNGEALVIKHGSGSVVSVYGHNRRLLVKEGQQVKAGQIIAEMGASGTDRVKLHFEIRQQSKTVNPLLYLPKR